MPQPATPGAPSARPQAPGPRRAPGILRTCGLVLAGIAALVGTAPLPAHAEAGGARVAITGRVEADGDLVVQQTITLPRGVTSLVQGLALTEPALDESHYAVEVGDITATADGKDLTPRVTTTDEKTVITLDTTAARGRPVTIGYRVTGAARAATTATGARARTEVVWPVLQGLSVPVESVTGTIHTPTVIDYLTCTAGPPASPLPCSSFSGATHDSPEPTFSDGPLAAGDRVTLDLGLPASAVAPNARLVRHWTVERAFRVDARTLLVALLPLLLGGPALLALHRRRGRDLSMEGPVRPVAEFTPVAAGQSHFTVADEVRPGHVGTVADEHVDPVDVTATLLDLSVRGWLRIIELPASTARQVPDWAFERREAGEGKLAAFEATLREAVAPQAGPAARVSTLREHIAPVLGRVQSELYDEVVQRGWFDSRPDTTRSRWALLGWAAVAAAVVATGLLVAFTGYGLLGLALVMLALGALLVAHEMPRRTAAGAALLGGLSALSSQLAVQPTGQLVAGREYDEISRILPYAVVLGGRERWLHALVDADADDTPDGTDLDWYHAPADWHLRELPDALHAFIITVQGVLTAR